MEIAAAAAVPRTYPISLVPSPCKAATMRPIFSTRWPKMSATARTLSSKCDQASATATIIEPRKNQKFYLSEEDEEEMETDSNFIKRLELLEEQALQIGNDFDDSEDGGGREATDYNRRAQLFDKCSKVFQALKHG